MLAFFIWLALTTVQGSSGELGASVIINSEDKLCIGGGAFFCDADFQKYLITIAFLIGGLMVTQQIGGAAGSIAGRGMAAVRKAGRIGVGAGLAGIFATGRKLDTLQMKAQKKVAGWAGVEKYHPKSLDYRIFAKGWQLRKEEAMEKYETMGGREAHLSTVWMNTLDKYLRIGQYLAFRKSHKKIAKDAKEADRLEERNAVLNEKLRFVEDEDYRKERREYYRKNKDAIIKNYQQKGFNGKEEYLRDWEILNDNLNNFDEKALRKEIKDNQGRINKLRKTQWFGFERYAKPFDYDRSDAGAKEQIKKKEDEIARDTGGEDVKVINRMLKALNEKDATELIASLRISGKNNDFNEIMKDKRVIHLLTKQNGILDKMVRAGVFGKNVDIDKLKKDFREKPVTPAHVQAMIRGFMKEVGLDEKTAARHASEIGSITFEAGSGLAYGMAYGDAATGDYKFDKLEYRDGELRTSERRQSAVAGKFSNLEPQTKMRKIHPDIFIIEDENGGANGIHEDAKEFLKSLSIQDLSHINRMRPDVINKIGSSHKTMKATKEFAEELSQSANQQDREQAEIIKHFVGYIKSRKESRSLDNVSHLKGAIESYDEI
jgi:hypothetical protein